MSNNVIEKLDRQSNKSGTVEEALNLYFNHKDTVRRLAEGVERIAELLEKGTKPRPINSRELPCCIERRPNPETEVLPCIHWKWNDGVFVNILSGERIEV